jgi:hypothetical protein
MIKAKPSIPKIRFTFKVVNQLYFSKNWNCVMVVLNEKNKRTQAFKINNDQKSEKLRINFMCGLWCKS